MRVVVLGSAAYHYDGTLYWDTGLAPGYPQVANLDDDPEPEVLLTNVNGLSVIEHDGTIKYQDKRPTNDPVGFDTWLRPATVHDFDGNGKAEYAMSSADHYTEYNADATIKWSAPVSDQSGIAAGTAFDFLGDGHAEAMYADEQYLWVFDGSGQPIFQMPRTSGSSETTSFCKRAKSSLVAISRGCALRSVARGCSRTAARQGSATSSAAMNRIMMSLF